MIGGQPFLEGVCVIIGPLDEGLASHVVLHAFFGRIECLVVGSARGGVDQPASDAGYKESVVDFELNSMFQGLALGFEHLVEAVGLSDRPREAVQNEAALG